MYNHQPSDWICPLCVFSKGGETEHNKRGDIVYEDDTVLAYVSPKWWPNNPGNIMIIPKVHTENVYDISDEALSTVQLVGKRLAITMKEAYGCEGTSFRQHNEPAGGQDLWHYHLHLFPRWKGDDLYMSHLQSSYNTESERAPYAQKMREALA